MSTHATHKQLLDEWIAHEKSKGLVDLKLTFGGVLEQRLLFMMGISSENPSQEQMPTLEQLCKEAYELLTSPTVPDFGLD